MKELIEKIKDLARISEALEPDKESRNNYIKQVMSFANEFMDSMDHEPTYYPNYEKSDKLKIRKERRSLKDIIDIYDTQIAKKGINAASGGHLGYIPGGGLFTSSLADLMVDVTNEYAGMFFASPGAVSMENELIDWMKSIFSYPDSAIGNLTSGGSIANLIALTSARDKYKIKGAKIEKSVIYLSPQTHHCIHKALRIIGLEDIIIRQLKLDENWKIEAADLHNQIKSDQKKGLNPFMAIASAGTTDTGAVDPLNEIGEIAKLSNLWFHIDAAYGGFFILSESKKALFKGIELSDSIVIDPHKGLFLPYGIGAVLIKDKEAVYHTHHMTASYMQDALHNDAPINPADVSPELTKHFRGMRMWLPLQLHGIPPFIACLEEKIQLTAYMRIQLSEMGFSLGPEPDLSVSYFWYDLTAINTDEFNKKLLEFMHSDGSSFFSSTLLNGQFVIRLAILSFRTKLNSVNKALSMISECLIKTKKHFVKNDNK